MYVKFKTPWFAPSAGKLGDGRAVNGKLYRRGHQHVPDEFKDILPKDAQIVEGPAEAPAVSTDPHELRAFDQLRADSDEIQRVTNEVENQLDEKAKEDEAEKAARELGDRMAKARQAKRAKREAKEKEAETQEAAVE